MEYIKIRKQDSGIVPCVKCIPEKHKGIVIAIHGFSSNKECATYKMLLKRLPEVLSGKLFAAAAIRLFASASGRNRRFVQDISI